MERRTIYVLLTLKMFCALSAYEARNLREAVAEFEHPNLLIQDKQGKQIFLTEIDHGMVMAKELTLGFSFKGTHYELELIQAEGSMGENYKEIHVHGRNLREKSNSSTMRNHRLDCFYRGRVKDMPGSAVALAICGKDSLFGTVFAGDVTIEIQKHRVEGLVAYSLADVHSHEFGKCALDHIPSLHLQRNHERRLEVNECADRPEKIVEILAVIDESLHALRGDDTENFIGQIVNVMSTMFNTLQNEADFSCQVNFQLIGQLVFRNDFPEEISRRSCDTLSPFSSYDFVGGSNACCNDFNSCTPGVTTCVDTTGCGTDTESNYRSEPGCWSFSSSFTQLGSKRRIMYYPAIYINQDTGENECKSDSNDADEISESEMMNDFLSWVDSERSKLEELFGGSIDNAILFSGKDFSGNTVGIANLEGMCKPDRTGSVVQATSQSLTSVAATAAHEVGHNFALTHDPPGIPGSNGYIMAGTAGSVVPTTFSSRSRAEINEFMNNLYVGDLRCLENFEAARTWDEDVDACGNGIIEDGEECDPGFGIDVSCCDSSNCRLKDGCLCNPNDPCCSNEGQLRPEGAVCRPSVDPECDFAETCSGSSAECGRNIIVAPGTQCRGQDLSGFIYGVCYGGSCITTNFDCTTIDRPRRCETIGNGCDSYCSETGTGTCYGFPGASNGVPCGDGKQCFTSPTGSDEAVAQCVDSTELKYFTWHLSLWSTCSPEGIRTRTAICRDEEGNEAQGLCKDDAPQTIGVCEGTSPLPGTLSPSATVDNDDGANDNDDLSQSPTPGTFSPTTPSVGDDNDSFDDNESSNEASTMFPSLSSSMLFLSTITPLLLVLSEALVGNSLHSP